MNDKYNDLQEFIKDYVYSKNTSTDIPESELLQKIVQIEKNVFLLNNNLSKEINDKNMLNEFKEANEELINTYIELLLNNNKELSYFLDICTDNYLELKEDLYKYKEILLNIKVSYNKNQKNCLEYIDKVFKEILKEDF